MKAKKRIRIISILVSLIMVIGLLPMPVLAAEYPGAATVTIGGTSFAVNAYYKNGDTGSFTGDDNNYNAWYDASNGILHLKDFEATDVIRCSSSSDLVIEAKGTNTLTALFNTNGENNAIYSSGLITFEGDGTLTVSVSNSNNEGANYAIHSNKGINIGDNITLNVSSQSGKYSYGIYGGGGVIIEDNAEVTVTSNADVEGIFSTGISAYEGPITITSSNPTTINLKGISDGVSNIAIYNKSNNSNTEYNGNITFSGTGTVTINNNGQAHSVGIMSEPTDADNNPTGVILLDSAEVEINNCDKGIVGISKKRSPAEADIVIDNASNLIITSTKGSPEGIVSALNGILIDDSNVSISTKGGGLSTKYSTYPNKSLYGIDIKGTSNVSLTSTISGGYMLYANASDVCDFDLDAGGIVEIKDKDGYSSNMMRNTYIQLGNSTTVNDSKGSKHSTEEAYSYGKNDGKLVFAGDVFTEQPSFARIDNEQGTISFKVYSVDWTVQPKLIPTNGDENSQALVSFDNQNVVQSKVVTSSSIEDGNYRIAVKYGDNWFISEEFEVSYTSNLAFTKQPKAEKVAVGEQVYPSWELNFTPDDVLIESGVPNGQQEMEWSTFSTYANATGGSLAVQQSAGSYNLRVKATKGGETIYSDTFIVSWEDTYEFSVDPLSINWGTVDLGSNYVEKTATIKNIGTKSFYLEPGTKTGFNISIDNSNLSLAAGSQTTLRISPVSNIEAGIYNFDLTVNATDNSQTKFYKAIPVSIEVEAPSFETVPQGGTVAVNETHEVNFELSKTPNSLTLEWWNDYTSAWATKENLSLSATNAIIPAESIAGSKQYRIAANYNIGYTYTVAKEFTVTWVEASEINQLSATLNGFVAGATVDSVTVTPGDSNYTATIKQWQHNDDVFECGDYANFPKLGDSETFVTGETYVVGINFKAVSPNTLATSTDATINENEGYIGDAENGGKTYYAVLSIPGQKSTTVTVKTEGELRNALSSGSGRTKIILGDNITIEDSSELVWSVQHATNVLDLNGYTLNLGTKELKIWIYENAQITFCDSTNNTGKILGSIDSGRQISATSNDLMASKSFDIIFDGGTYKSSKEYGTLMYIWGNSENTQTLTINKGNFINYNTVYGVDNEVETVTIHTMVRSNTIGSSIQISQEDADVSTILDNESELSYYTYSDFNYTPHVITSGEDIYLIQTYLGYDTIVKLKSGFNVTVPTFDDVQYGYASVTEKNISIYNRGNDALQVKEVISSAPSFTIGGVGTPTINSEATDTTFTVKPADGLAVGTHTAEIVVKDMSNNEYKATVSFKVEPMEIAPTIANIDPVTYNGTEQTPELSVIGNSEALVKDTDYTVAFENNTNAGTATAKITAKAGSNYTWDGEVTKDFTINPKAIEPTIASIADQEYTGNPIEPTIEVTGDSKTLVKDTDYTVSYGTNTNVGTGTVKVTGKGNYTWDNTQAYATKTFNIVGYTLKDEDVSLEFTTTEYTGSPITPTVTVTVNSSALSEATDYDVIYTDHTNVGTATVTVTGTGNYGGSVDKNFDITPKTITPTIANIDPVTYNGSEQTPELIVTGNSEPLVKDTDYTVAFENNTNAGTATAKITAKAGSNYTWNGEVTKEFTINPMTITPIIADITSATYNGNAHTPELSVTGNSEALVKDTDYTVTFENNTNAGTATAKITAKAGSNYTWDGEVTKNFTISPATSTLSGVPTDVTDSTNTTAFVQVGKTKDISTYVSLIPNAYQNDVTFALTDAGSTGVSLDTDGKTLKGATAEGIVKLTASFAGKNVDDNGENEYSAASDLVFYVKVVNKEEVTIDGLTYSNKEYDGTVVEPTGTLTVTENKVEVNDLDKVFEKYNTSTTTWEAFDEASAVNVGRYRVTYSVNSDNANYMGTKTYEFEITVKKLAKPTLSGTYAYTGTEQTATLNNFVEGKMIVENNKATIVGIQNITVKLADKTNYAWVEDDSTTDLTIPFEITKATPVVTLSNLSQKVGSVTEVTYTFAPALTDGTVTVEYKVSTADDSTYAVTLPTEKGTYSVRISLVGDTNLNDAQKVDTLSITKKSSGSSGGGSSSVTKYEITVTAGKGGSISPETTKVEKGDDKKFTIKANDGYEIEDVLVDGKSVGAVENYKFENVKAKHTIKAIFKKIEVVEDNKNTEEKEEIKDVEDTTTWENPFKDVKEDAWYYNAVEFANEKRLFSGMSENEFAPNVSMTRGMFVTVLSKLNDGEIEGELDFADVDVNAYYAKPVAWAYENGIVNGVAEGMFAPNMSITREQLAVMMYNYMIKEGIEKPASLVEFPEFEDAGDISSWATNAVNVMRATGLMSGKPGNKFDPKGTATRAEVATILMNFCK